MIEVRQDKNLRQHDLEQLYMAKGQSRYESRFGELHKAVTASDYLITAWADEQLVGILRSSGDGAFTQYISDFIVHPDFRSQGIASSLMDTYLEAVAHVDEIYLFFQNSGPKTFTGTWLAYRGFSEIKGGSVPFIYLRKKA
ncbi:GNAT family N-acetyltransferase [Salinicoccus siamensis]|uniref:GNAT family N-acetyltransferase n=1 Tax=Salinicoccus siamensis TaxID=381830 RepID=A0ABV5Z209_9STAP